MALVAGQKLRVSDLSGSGSGGGGGGGGGIVIATADTTVNNSTSLVDVSGLSAAVVANATYSFTAWLLYSSGTGPDIKYQPSTPTGAIGNWSLLGYGRDVSPVIDVGAGAAFMAAAIGTSLTVAGDSVGTTLLATTAIGSFTTSSTAGTFKLKVGQKTATASNTLARAGSWMQLTRIS